MVSRAAATTLLALALPSGWCLCLPLLYANACGPVWSCSCTDGGGSLTWSTASCTPAGGWFRSPRGRQRLNRQLRRAVRSGVLTEVF